MAMQQMLQGTITVVKTPHALVGQVAVNSLASVLRSGGAGGWKPLSDGNTSISRDFILELDGGNGPCEQPHRCQQQRHRPYALQALLLQQHDPGQPCSSWPGHLNPPCCGLTGTWVGMSRSCSDVHQAVVMHPTAQCTVSFHPSYLFWFSLEHN